MLISTKPNSTTRGTRATKKTTVVKREQNTSLNSADRWLSIMSILVKVFLILESLPWDKVYHLIM